MREVLHPGLHSWYLRRMNDSWIALADRRGLRLLVLETSHAIRFLLRRAERENAECFWVVLTPYHARFINDQRALGDAATALRTLEQLATNMGRLLPQEPALPVWLPEYVTIPEKHDREWDY